MKFDKDFLLKNRFWVLLCVAVPLTVIAMIFLGFIVPSSTAALKKKTDSDYKKLKDFGIIKNQKWIDQADKELKKAKEEEKKVWENAWLAQEKLYTWPDQLDKNFKQGYFIKAIRVYPPDTKDALSPAESEDRYYGVFHGVIVKAADDNQSIQVKALKAAPGAKTLAVRDFFDPGTDQAKITIVGKEGESKTFVDLQNYKNHKVAITFEKGKAFGDELTAKEQLEYAKAYQDQIVPILREVGPLNDLKEPVVQFGIPTSTNKDRKVWPYSEKLKELFFLDPAAGANRGVNEFFPYVPKTWNHFQVNYNSTRDAWTLQENLWVTRELFTQLHSVNQEVATFQPKGKLEGKEPTYYFENPFWRLELQLLDNNKVKVTIKNLIDRRQKIPQMFKVKFTKDSKFLELRGLSAASPSLAPRGIEGTTADGKKIQDWFTKVFDLRELDPRKQLKGVSPKTVLSVEQVLTWETAGVKRIDAIHIGSQQAQSHRTCNRPLKSFFPEKKEVEEVGEDGKKKPAAPKEESKNGIGWERYLDVTPQSRRLPVALVVIVDQDQVYRVQAALADCNFRFLATQEIMSRFPESLRPETTPDPMTPGTPDSTPAEQTNVELVIYGVITLYERYPPRPAQPTGP